MMQQRSIPVQDFHSEMSHVLGVSHCQDGGTHVVAMNAPKLSSQVSVTAGEVKNAIVNVDRLFVISIVKSRLKQRLARARKNIARRRQQATPEEREGPSLSDSEKVQMDLSGTTKRVYPPTLEWVKAGVEDGQGWGARRVWLLRAGISPVGVCTQ